MPAVGTKKDLRRVGQSSSLRPGQYLVRGRNYDITSDHLKSYVHGTQRMLEDGLEIPILRRHTEPGDPTGGPQLEREPASDETKGWLSDCWQEQDGSMSWVGDVDDETYKGINNGTVKFSSPELVAEYVNGLGTKYGDVFRHIALTPKPRTQDQGPITTGSMEPFYDGATLAMSEGTGLPMVMQFSLEDYIEEEDELYGEGTEGEDQMGPGTEQGYDEPDAMDAGADFIPPAQNTGGDLAQLAKQLNTDLEQCGIAAPTANPTKDVVGYLSQLCIALRQKFRTESDQQADQQQDAMNDDEFNVQEEADYMSQYSENGQVEKIVAQLSEKKDDPAAQKLVTAFSEQRKQLQELTQQFSEQKLGEQRGILHQKFEKAGDPFACKLKELCDTVQFGEEGEEQPTLTLQQAHELYLSVVPKQLQFSADTVAEQDTGRDHWREEKVSERRESDDPEGMSDEDVESLTAEAFGIGQSFDMGHTDKDMTTSIPD